MNIEDTVKELTEIIRDAKYIQARVSSPVIKFHIEKTKEHLERYRDRLKSECTCMKWWNEL